MARPLVLIVMIVGIAALAKVVVYGSGSPQSASPLAGYVLPSAFTGGVALAFSWPFLLVLVPYLTVLVGDVKKEGPDASGRDIDWGPAACYLVAFSLAFVVTISGFPSAIAGPIYRSEWLIDPAGGVVFIVWGLLAFLGLVRPSPDHLPPSVSRRVAGAASACVLGATTGALMYHELDPTYDSVFFFTANAVAASHAPLTVAVFTTGLGFTYLAAGGAAGAIVSQARRGGRMLAGGRALSGIATALIGLAMLTHRFDAVRGLLF